jgi:hypothetical protein
MKIRVIEVSGTPEELLQLPQLSDFLQPDRSDNTEFRTVLSSAGETEFSPTAGSRGVNFPHEVISVLSSRGPAARVRALVDEFLDEVMAWPDVDVRVGMSRRNQDGLANMLRLHRRRSPLGAFVYLRLPSARLMFRLPVDYDLSGYNHAVPRDVQADEPYGVTLRLSLTEALPEALKLARIAYEACISSDNTSMPYSTTGDGVSA